MDLQRVTPTSSADLSRPRFLRPVHGACWGPWRYDAARLVLLHESAAYEIDLETCTNSARVLDWIFQVTAKRWCTAPDAHCLLLAVEELLSPQATLCSCGQSKTLNVRWYLQANDPEGRV